MIAKRIFEILIIFFNGYEDTSIDFKVLLTIGILTYTDPLIIYVAYILNHKKDPKD